MPLILGTNSIKDTGYDVANSCRFNDGDSPRLHRTLGTATDVDKWTFSCWFKRSTLSATQYLFYGYASGEESAIVLKSDDTIDWYNYFSSSEQGQLVTNRKFRDVGAWYHIVCAYDSDNGTAGNRMRMYINGTEETSFATDTNPASDENSTINKAVLHNIGMKYSDSGSGYFDGYLAEVCFVDGQQLTPSSFGEFDDDTPTVFKPIDVSGLTFGTNGFYLDFEDSGDLGDDESGNGNDFTETNLAATDQSIDTCTNNFATTNPLLHGGTVATLSEGNLKLSIGSSWKHGIPTIGVSSGKWYMEAKIGSMGEYYGGGVIDSYEINSWGASGSSYAGQKTLSIGYYSSGTKYIGDSSSSYGASYTTGDIVSTAIDLDAGTPTVTFYKNGASQGAVNLPTSSNSTGLWFFMPSLYNGTLELNYGSPSFAISSGNTDGNGYGNFEYAVPSGYYSLCTKNLAEYG